MADAKLIAEVTRLKATLERADSPKEALLEALSTLRGFGSLPVKVLTDTLIGKRVHSVAKHASDEAVRKVAQQLLEEWRGMHRKRKAGEQPDAKPELELHRVASSSSLTSQDSAKSNDGLRNLRRMSSEEAYTQYVAQTSGQERRPSSVVIRHEQREKVRQKLVDALGKHETAEGKDGAAESMRDPVLLAVEIEEALSTQMSSEKEYLNQARSIAFNLKDSKNPAFRFKLMVGFYDPEQVPRLTAEDMASDAKNTERAKLRKFSMEEIQTDWALKNGQQKITGMFTCGKCKGEKTTYFQMQTRSSDEPMTTFVTCLACNNRWKFC